MSFPLEPFRPLADSLCWRLHDAYFAARGIDAWTGGDIPFDATNNDGIATQHARFLIEVAPALWPEGDVWLMEVGAGLGRFADQVLRALARHGGPAGRALTERLHFVVTDYQRSILEQAAATPHLADHVASGRVKLALYDLRDPTRLVGLDGAAHTPSIAAIYANYVCCVMPPLNIRQRGPTWMEQTARLTLDGVQGGAEAQRAFKAILAQPAREADFDRVKLEVRWRRASLDSMGVSARDRAALEALCAGRSGVTVTYPRRYFDFVSAARVLLRPNGIVVTSDYGHVDPRRLLGKSQREPQRYGHSLAFQVDFPAFAAFAEADGWRNLTTSDPVRSTHTAILRAGTEAISPALETAFDRHYRTAHEGEDLVDFYDLAKDCADADDHARAARLFARCVELAPDAAVYRFKLAESLADAGHFEVAIAEAKAGLDLRDADQHDFAFLIGRASCLADRFEDAVIWYERSLKDDEHAVTLTNLAVLYEHFGRSEDARTALDRALILDPDYDKALRRREALTEPSAA